MFTRQQLQRKEEQRLTAIRLLKQAKKRHEEHKLGEEMKKNLSGKEKGFEGGTPGSYAGSNLSFAPPPSIMGSVMSLGRRSKLLCWKIVLMAVCTLYILLWSCKYFWTHKNPSTKISLSFGVESSCMSQQ